ncbi:MAG: phenylalanine--tRNA ligase subunit beta [Candidatus Gracilibacteria bacterium]|nr:phenylalanine--tRNA ligase subunit beta [Candidatus Gracilibacteria bacterium]
MKVSYKILKKYLPYLENALKTSQDLIMHTAEVEEINSQKQDFENMVVGKIIKIEKHPDADSLRICLVDIGEKDNLQIVCGGSNLEVGQLVAVAKIGASVLWHGEGEKIVMKKTTIRGVESFGMICASEEIGLKDKFPAKSEKEILDLSFLNVVAGKSLSEALEKDDEILEIDNKAINHRPDMFSYMGILRELATINGRKLDLEYKNIDFSKLPELKAKNEIPEVVQRYSLLKVSGVGNTISREEIETIIEAAGHGVKGLLVDVSNYSLYFYGQPAHIFDGDKIEGNITVRYAKSGETLEALDDKIYELSDKDIVIADDKKVLALGGIIGGKSSAVSETTKNIIIETAHFDQAVLRMTGKKLGVRTDALNVFEKDILPELASYATSLIVEELKLVFPNLKLENYFDSYTKKQEIVKQQFDLEFYNNLIGASYKQDYVENILANLGIKKVGNELLIPFWRKELNFKADIAEEIARIDGYDNIITTVPRINLGAIVQDNTYYLKNDSRAFFTGRGFFDVYNYSFVNKDLTTKLNLNINDCVALKNSLSEEQTHMRNSLIPNLMRGLEDNIRDRNNIKLFEIEKVFSKNGNEISEDYYLSGVMTASKDLVYYDIQNIVSDFFKTIFVDNFYFEITSNYPAFAHGGRIAKIIVRGKEVGFVGEIHPTVAKRFDVKTRVGFFEIEVSKLLPHLYNKVKAHDLSNFQENNFDLSFVVDKELSGREIALTISGVDKKLIKKVELFDIYENEEKLPGKRSLSFKVFIQSMEGTISDEIKGNLIKNIVAKVEKKGGSLR